MQNSKPLDPFDVLDVLDPDTLRFSITVFRPPFSTHLETMKFICKEFFLFIYSKQIDNLRTNHRVGQGRAWSPSGFTYSSELFRSLV